MCTRLWWHGDTKQTITGMWRSCRFTSKRICKLVTDFTCYRSAIISRYPKLTGQKKNIETDCNIYCILWEHSVGYSLYYLWKWEATFNWWSTKRTETLTLPLSTKSWATFSTIPTSASEAQASSASTKIEIWQITHETKTTTIIFCSVTRFTSTFACLS